MLFGVVEQLKDDIDQFCHLHHRNRDRISRSDDELRRLSQPILVAEATQRALTKGRLKALQDKIWQREARAGFGGELPDSIRQVLQSMGLASEEERRLGTTSPAGSGNSWESQIDLAEGAADHGRDDQANADTGHELPLPPSPSPVTLPAPSAMTLPVPPPGPSPVLPPVPTATPSPASSPIPSLSPMQVSIRTPPPRRPNHPARILRMRIPLPSELPPPIPSRSPTPRHNGFMSRTPSPLALKSAPKGRFCGPADRTEEPARKRQRTKDQPVVTQTAQSSGQQKRPPKRSSRGNLPKRYGDSMLH